MIETKKLKGRAKDAYVYIVEAISTGKLKPNEPIGEVELTSNLNFSRTPIREALCALEQDGLIARSASRGWYVIEVTTHDIEEVFELRKLLETHALLSSFPYFIMDDVLDLKDRIAALTENSSNDDYFELDRELHSMLIVNCGNHRLIDMLNTLNMQIERDRNVSAKKPKRLTSSREEHLAILDAILAKDEKKATELLGEHIDNVKDSTLLVRRYGW